MTGDKQPPEQKAAELKAKAQSIMLQTKLKESLMLRKEHPQASFLEIARRGKEGGDEPEKYSLITRSQQQMDSQKKESVNLKQDEWEHLESKLRMRLHGLLENGRQKKLKRPKDT
ncbi:hypothetical protein U0070_025898 [Myodes glareolus]|uniref:Uncharacterized protein n=1 Tax=Myodes glareolus TaxID=447135 RepID=A0AAW0HUB8_MYOGA